MSKKVIAKVSMLLLILSIFTGSVYAVNGGNKGSDNDFEIETDSNIEIDDDYQKEEVRAIWVATVYGLDFPSMGVTTDSEVLKKEILEEVYQVKVKIFEDDEDGSLLVVPEAS